MRRVYPERRGRQTRGRRRRYVLGAGSPRLPGRPRGWDPARAEQERPAHRRPGGGKFSAAGAGGLLSDRSRRRLDARGPRAAGRGSECAGRRPLARSLASPARPGPAGGGGGGGGHGAGAGARRGAGPAAEGGRRGRSTARNGAQRPSRPSRPGCGARSVFRLRGVSCCHRRPLRVWALRLPLAPPRSPPQRWAGLRAWAACVAPRRPVYRVRESQRRTLLAPPCLSFPGRKPTPRVPLDASSDPAVPAAQLVQSAGAEARRVTRGLARRPLGQVGGLRRRGGRVQPAKPGGAKSSEKEKVMFLERGFEVLRAAIKTRALVAPYSCGCS